MNSDIQGFACRKVWDEGAPILQVCLDDDGTWQFLCGGDEHTSADQAVLIHARHMFDLQPELSEVAGLAPGYYAWRNTVSEPWQIYKDTPDD